MSDRGAFNLMLVGVGGQGVVSLARVFQHLSMIKDVPSQSSIIKGGAQRLGTVRAQIRLFPPHCRDYRYYSPVIPAGACDLLIGLEPWEAVRMSSWLVRSATILVNSARIPLVVERHREIRINEPVALLSGMPFKLEARDFSSEAQQAYETTRMMNFVMGLQAVENYLPHFERRDFVNAFLEVVPSARQYLA